MYYLLTCFPWLPVPQYNRVWIPDPENVWKSAEILKDFHFGDNVLELLLEDGTVSKKMWLIKPSRATVVSLRWCLWWWETTADLTLLHNLWSWLMTGALLPCWPVKTSAPSSSQPWHLGWGEWPHCSQLPPWTCCAAQSQSAICGVQDHLHLLWYSCTQRHPSPQAIGRLCFWLNLCCFLICRYYTGGCKSLQTAAYLWRCNHSCLLRPEHGRHGPSYICSGRRGLQTDGKVNKTWKSHMK